MPVGAPRVVPRGWFPTVSQAPVPLPQAAEVALAIPQALVLWPYTVRWVTNPSCGRFPAPGILLKYGEKKDPYEPERKPHKHDSPISDDPDAGPRTRRRVAPGGQPRVPHSHAPAGTVVAGRRLTTPISRPAWPCAPLQWRVRGRADLSSTIGELLSRSDALPVIDQPSFDETKKQGSGKRDQTILPDPCSHISS
jgi:hypothetical protein